MQAATAPALTYSPVVGSSPCEQYRRVSSIGAPARSLRFPEPRRTTPGAVPAPAAATHRSHRSTARRPQPRPPPGAPRRRSRTRRRGSSPGHRRSGRAPARPPRRWRETRCDRRASGPRAVEGFRPERRRVPGGGYQGYQRGYLVGRHGRGRAGGGPAGAQQVSRQGAQPMPGPFTHGLPGTGDGQPLGRPDVLPERRGIAKQGNVGVRALGSDGQGGAHRSICEPISRRSPLLRLTECFASKKPLLARLFAGQ